MSLRLIAKSMLVLSLASPFAIAHAAQISCPGIEKIQSAAPKLDTAQKYQGMYVAYTSSPAFIDGGYPWLVAAGNLRGNTDEEALADGKKVVANTHSRDTDYAIDTDQGVSYCMYNSGNVISVTQTRSLPNMMQFFK